MSRHLLIIAIFRFLPFLMNIICLKLEDIFMSISRDRVFKSTLKFVRLHPIPPFILPVPLSKQKPKNIADLWEKMIFTESRGNGFKENTQFTPLSMYLVECGNTKVHGGTS